MRSTTELASTLAGASNTRLHAQTPKNKPQGFGKPKDEPEGEDRPFDVWFDYNRLFVPIDGKDIVTDIVDYLMGKFGDVPVWKGKPTAGEHVYWDDTCKTVKGLDIRYRLPNPVRNEPEGLMQITFTGAVIASIERHRLLWVWYCLWRDYNARSTRLDIKLDDYDRVMPWDEVLESLSKGEIYRFRQADPRVKATAEGIMLTGFTFGSRESEVYMRLYDESLQTDSKGNWRRLEGEYKGDRAKQLFDELMKVYDRCKHERNHTQIVSSMFMPVLFNPSTGLLFMNQKLDENGEKDTRNRSRNGIVDFWQRFMDKVTSFFGNKNLSFNPVLPRPKKTDERIEKHIDRSGSNSISYWIHTYGWEDFKSRFVKDFEELPKEYKAIATAIQKETQKAMQYAMDKTIQTTQKIQQMFNEDWDSECSSS